MPEPYLMNEIFPNKIVSTLKICFKLNKSYLSSLLKKKIN